jgi:hypothetical protein
MTSANDDGSGSANLLEIGRALSRLLREGKLPRPRRDIRFWWVNEFASEEQFFGENASRLPWSLPHALEDVMESVLGMVRDGNTALLTTPAPSCRCPSPARWWR